jgi:ABC-type glycerol-3-phosphate transport system substrate-binding protein
VPVVAVRRADLWPAAPRHWADVLAAAPGLRRRGRPVAIGLSGELDSNAANVSMLLAQGGSLRRLRSRETVDYLHAIADLYRRGLPREAIEWSAASNNQLLFAGRASLIVNPLTTLAAAERAGLPFRLRLSPLPERSVPHTVGCYVLWRFSRNRELAERWLVDQQLGYREHFVRSGFLNVPAWTRAVPDGFAGMRRLAGPRYAPAVDAAARTVPAGYPGPTDAAVQELLDAFLLPTAARRVAQGKQTAAEALADAAEFAQTVLRKWREAKLI